MSSDKPMPEPPKQGVLQRILCSSEWKVFLLGLGVVAIYVCAIGVAYVKDRALYSALWKMTVTHILSGRAGGMSVGYTLKLDRSVVILANMVIETFMVFLLYPVFVFSFRRLIVIRPLESAIERVRRAARTHQRTVTRWGVAGLLIFVWAPFYMTGPVVGSVIGFLIGLRTWVNMVTVLLGTYLAIVCWGYVMDKVHENLAQLGPYVPILFTAMIVLLALAIQFRLAGGRRGDKPGDGGGQDDGSGRAA